MKRYYGLTSIIIAATACCSIPQAEESGRQATIYPDYTSVTIPPNISPMNFDIRDEADAYLTVLESAGSKPVVIRGSQVRIKAAQWSKLLENGGDLHICIYEKSSGKWQKMKEVVNHIAPEPIDGYLTYRLIEPTYGMAGEMCIAQRNLSNFDEKTIFNNKIDSNREKGQCINCHSFQNYQTSKMQFHVRQNDGGTIIVRNGKITKVNLKADGVMSPGVYPSWNPTEDIIAYSVNSTYQNFFSEGAHKTEVIDNKSDIILYYPEENRVVPVCTDTSLMETFPYWSVDGKSLYYACANAEGISKNKSGQVSEDYDKVRYSIMKRTFDLSSGDFSEPEMVFDAASEGKSATFPRQSPDGKYLLMTVGYFGNFHIWHKEADLYIMNLENGECKPLENINSNDTESYHSWSSNGRWIVVSSRRDDGLYTRLYIAYFDNNGCCSKAFLLPQKNPGYNIKLFKSYNIPEFSVDDVDISTKDFLKVVKGEAIKAKKRD